MRRYLLTAPRWLLSVFSGVVCVFCMGGIALIMDDFDRSRLLNSLAVGIVMGVVLGRQTYRSNQHTRAAVDPLTDDEFRRAADAGQRGPTPTDPRVREAAVQLTRSRLADYDNHRTANLSGFAGLLVGLTLAAIFDTWWWAVFVLLFALVLIDYLVRPTRIAHRLVDLKTVAVAGDPDHQYGSPAAPDDGEAAETRS
jgi:hypothetical protein